MAAARTGFDPIAAALHGPSLGVRLDVPREADRAETVGLIEARFGPLDILIHNSVAGHAAAPGLVAYYSSKWALPGLMRAAAEESARDGVRVNAVHPASSGPTPTVPTADSGSVRSPDGDLGPASRHAAAPRRGRPWNLSTVD